MFTEKGKDKAMETKDIIFELRTKAGLSQDALAEKVFVTRQAVSRWETGETIPNTETLKLLSGLFDVSINTILGSPRQLICQCCGMPLEDIHISKEEDGSFNEEYCKWCYTNGEFVYHNLDQMTHFLTEHFGNNPAAPTEDQLKEMLLNLDYWKQYIALGGEDNFTEFKKKIIEELNALGIEGMPKVEKLNALPGRYVNLAYPMPNGSSMTLLDDNQIYLGTELESEFGGERCFGIVCNMQFLLVCTYEANGENPELILYKQR